MAISAEQKKALEAAGYTVKGNGVYNKTGQVAGENWSGSSKVSDILKAKPKAEATPAPAPKKKATTSTKPAAKKSVTATASAAPKAGAGKAASANVSVARSGASRSAQNKVKPKYESPVPGRAIVMAIKNAFTGNGETDAAKISASGNPNLGKKATPASKKKTPAGAPNRSSIFKKKP